MNFNLDRELIFFDLEATGLNVVTDRIVQIALVKYLPQVAEPQSMVSIINPQMQIGEEAMSIHCITNETVVGEPTFNDLADQLYDFIGGGDLAGYNSNRFDIPMLIEEFARADKDFDMSTRRSIDVQRIFYRMEPRTLSAALQFYCNKKMTNAHDALADVEATVDILKGQIERYRDVDFEDNNGGIIKSPVSNNMEQLYQFTNDLSVVDATRRIKYNDKGVMVFNFGKHIGKPVLETIIKDKQYYDWILAKDFSHQVKQTLKKLMENHLAQKESG